MGFWLGFVLAAGSVLIAVYLGTLAYFTCQELFRNDHARRLFVLVFLVTG